MPPKAKISKEMIVNAAVDVARKSGADSINARTVSQELNCSTQPVMYHFATIDELKNAAYSAADEYHTNYLLNTSSQDDPMLGIGLNYIRFAVEEPNLFRFLFQSGFVKEKSLLDIIDSDELVPVLSTFRQELGMGMEQTKDIFLTVGLFTHGYASIVANYSMDYDETVIAAQLERVFEGAVMAVQKEEKQ